MKITLQLIDINASFNPQGIGTVVKDLDYLIYSTPDPTFLEQVKAKANGSEPVIERAIIVTGTSHKPRNYFIRDTYRPVNHGKEVIVSDRTFADNGNGLEQIR